MSQRSVDVAIVGAGPAGMAAAEVLAAAGQRVAVVDEQSAPGGQILRQPPQAIRVSGWLPGRLYSNKKALLQRALAEPRIQWMLGTTVLGIEETAAGEERRHRLAITSAHGGSSVLADSVLIATGCYDAPVCFPGWTSPGCMSTGGIQSFIKSQQLLPGERFVFVGTHPLQLLVADQVLAAGGKVAAVVFAQPQSALLSRLWPGLRVLRRASARVLEGLRAYGRLRRAGVPVLFGETIVKAEGTEHLEAVVLAPLDHSGKLDHARARRMACDRLGVCFRFIASTELSRQAGAEHDFSPLAGEWVARVDASCRTSRPGIYAAGEVTGVAGADAAILTGAIAAHAILQDLGRTREQGDAPALKGLRRRQSDERAFIEYLRRVGACSDDLLAAMLTDDTTVCKCQNLTAGELRATLRANPHIDDVNSLKLVSRVGMGLCQGRYCGSYARLVLAQARAGDRAAPPRPFTAQMPIKPVLISDLLDADRAAIEK